MENKWRHAAADRVHSACVIVVDRYSDWMLAARITFAYLSISRRKYAASSSGVLATGSPPSRVIASRTSADASVERARRDEVSCSATRQLAVHELLSSALHLLQ